MRSFFTLIDVNFRIRWAVEWSKASKKRQLLWSLIVWTIFFVVGRNITLNLGEVAAYKKNVPGPHNFVNVIDPLVLFLLFVVAEQDGPQ